MVRTMDTKNPSTQDPIRAPGEVLLLRLPDLIRMTQLSKSTIYNLIHEGEFPEPVKVGQASVWKAAAIHQWVEQLGEEKPKPRARMR